MSIDESFIETKDTKNVNNSQANITKTIKELIYQLRKVSDFNRFLYDRVTDLSIKIFTLREEIRIIKGKLREKIIELRKTAENILEEL
jgi:hypothetical protein